MRKLNLDNSSGNDETFENVALKKGQSADISRLWYTCRSWCKAAECM